MKSDIVQALTVGNSAKLYCLNWIEQHISQRRGEIAILDLGCGEALNFVNLLNSYPQIRYVGVEPGRQSYLRAQTHLKGLNALVVNCDAYNSYERLREEFDIVVSFSVLEHVYRRRDYLRSAKECLKTNGYCLINYDAGHFVFRSVVDRVKSGFRSTLASLGVERYYQSFVTVKEFLRMIAEVGFGIVESKYFNIYSLKGIYKVIPEDRRWEYMNQWLTFELGLNELGMNYVDALARHFGTLNFILVDDQLCKSSAPVVRENS